MFFGRRGRILGESLREQYSTGTLDRASDHSTLVSPLPKIEAVRSPAACVHATNTSSKAGHDAQPANAPGPDCLGGGGGGEGCWSRQVQNTGPGLFLELWPGGGGGCNKRLREVGPGGPLMSNPRSW